MSVGNDKTAKDLLKEIISSRWEQLDDAFPTTTPEDVAEKFLQVLSVVPEDQYNSTCILESILAIVSPNKTNYRANLFIKKNNLSRLIHSFDVFSANLYKHIWHRDVENDLKQCASLGEIAIKHELLQPRKVGDKIIALRKMRNRLVYDYWSIAEINEKELDSATQDLIDLYILAIAENAKLMDLDL